MAANVIAGEAPKEVAVNGKIVTTGKLVAHNAVGNPMGKEGEAGVAEVFSYDEMGTETFDSPLLLPLEVHCFGFTQVMNRIEESHGYCIGTDSEGDQVLRRTTVAAHPAGASAFAVSDEVLFGTGKYAGFSGVLASTCQIEMKGAGYANACDDKGTYRRR